MNIEQSLIDKVESKINKQNTLSAAFFVGLWNAPVLLVWYALHVNVAALGAVMLFVSGLLTGFSVRLHGKGYSFLFSLIAFISHAWVVILAFGLNIVVAGPISGIFLFGLYIFGAYAAIKISRIELPFEEHRAYDYLTKIELNKSVKKLKNRWFTVLPLLVLTASFSLLTAGGLKNFEEEYAQEQRQQSREKKLEVFNSKEIDVTPKGLERLSNQDVLLYSYAYYSGMLYNKVRGHRESFPRSEYKSQTLLKYLVDYRKDVRAKFILGLLTYQTTGRGLMQEAADQGDKYARFYTTAEYGCYAEHDLAVNLLKNLYKLEKDRGLKNEIKSIMSLGFEGFCQDLENPQYILSYAIVS